MVDDIDLAVKLDLWVCVVLQMLTRALSLIVLNLLEMLEGIVPEFVVSRSILDLSPTRLLDSIPNWLDWGTEP